MILFEIDIEFADYDTRTFSAKMKDQIIAAHIEAQTIMFTVLLGHVDQGGIPVVSGYLKSSFETIAEQLGITIDYDAQEHIIKSYGEGAVGKFAGYFQSKIGQSDQSDIRWLDRGFGVTTWAVESASIDNVDQAYLLMNEFGPNAHTNWRWQATPPWNMFSGPQSPKTEALNFLRKAIAKIVQRGVNRLRIKSKRFNSKRDNLGRLMTLAHELTAEIPF